MNARNSLIGGALALVAAVGGLAWYQSEHVTPATTALYNSAAPNALNSFNDANGTSSLSPSNPPAAQMNAAPSGYLSATDQGYRSRTYANNYVSNDGYTAGAPSRTYVSGRYIQSIRRPVRVYYPPAQTDSQQYSSYQQETGYEVDRAQPNAYTNGSSVPDEHRTYGNPRRVYNNNYVERTTVYDRHHPRSTKKSVAIVAGSAAGGAAIGALAGGGKGAGIGALAGGGAGFIYDRLTHNR